MRDILRSKLEESASTINGYKRNIDHHSQLTDYYQGLLDTEEKKHKDILALCDKASLTDSTAKEGA